MESRFLFVGGPADGKYIAIPAKTATITIPTKAGNLIQAHLYHRRTLQIDEKDFTIYASQSLSNDEVVALIQAKYVRTIYEDGIPVHYFTPPNEELADWPTELELA